MFWLSVVSGQLSVSGCSKDRAMNRRFEHKVVTSNKREGRLLLQLTTNFKLTTIA